MKDIPTLEAMEKYGGAFVRSLARLARVADPNNYAALEAAFPQYFAEYKQIAKEESTKQTA